MRGLKQQHIAILLLLAATVVAIFALIAIMNSKPNVVQSSISISGEIVCLPHKDTTGPTTLECAYGLKADDGRYYGLRNYDSTGFNTSDSVKVSGDLKPEQSDIYDISGMIDVQTISEN